MYTAIIASLCDEVVLSATVLFTYKLSIGISDVSQVALIYETNDYSICYLADKLNYILLAKKNA
jgi:hypothetical protein